MLTDDEQVALDLLLERHADSPDKRASWNDLADVDDAEALKALQLEIEAGGRVYIVGHPVDHGPYVRVPLYRAQKEV